MEIQAPEPLAYPSTFRSVFLAGSIEMGSATKWQDEIIKKLSGTQAVFFNPRRDDWDSSWKQEIGDPQFNQQVNWELRAMEQADLIIMYLDPNTKSPISMLELGLHAKSKKLVVCCPEGFWRKGNIDIVCAKYGIEQAKDLDDLIEITRRRMVL